MPEVVLQVSFTIHDLVRQGKFYLVYKQSYIGSNLWGAPVLQNTAPPPAPKSFYMHVLMTFLCICRTGRGFYPELTKHLY